MRLMMLGGNGSARFIQGTCAAWTDPKVAGDAIGVTVHTPQGSAGFIFSEVALKHIAERKGAGQ